MSRIREGDDEKFLLSDERLLKMTPSDIDEYIEWVQFNHILSSTGLRKLKEQRRRVVNRVYAHNCRSRKKKEVDDLVRENLALMKERDHWKNRAKMLEKELKSQVKYIPPIPSIPHEESSSSSYYSSDSPSLADLYDLI
jgi:hypothetical protein